MKGATCFAGGARLWGYCPRWTVLTIHIGPPQSGHGARNVSGGVASSDGWSGCAGLMAWKSARTLPTVHERSARRLICISWITRRHGGGLSSPVSSDPPVRLRNRKRQAGLPNSRRVRQSRASGVALARKTVLALPAAQNPFQHVQDFLIWCFQIGGATDLRPAALRQLQRQRRWGPASQHAGHGFAPDIRR